MTREEAIKKIKEWDFLDDSEKKVLETLIPELAESEDEKIKQKFIKLVKMSSEVGGFALHKWEADEMLAWLEKQSEKTVWTDNDRIMVSTLMRDVEQINYINQEGKNKRLEWLKSLENRYNKEK